MALQSHHRCACNQQKTKHYRLLLVGRGWILHFVRQAKKVIRSSPGTERRLQRHPEIIVHLRESLGEEALFRDPSCRSR